MKLLSKITQFSRTAKRRFVNTWYWLGLQILLLTAAANCHADNVSQGMAGMKTNVSNQAVAISTTIQIFVGLLGVAIACIGLYKLYQAGKSDQSREEATTGWKLIGIGVLCLSFWYVIYLVGGTIWGDGQSATQQQRALIQQQ